VLACWVSQSRPRALSSSPPPPRAAAQTTVLHSAIAPVSSKDATTPCPPPSTQHHNSNRRFPALCSNSAPSDRSIQLTDDGFDRCISRRVSVRHQRSSVALRLERNPRLRAPVLEPFFLTCGICTLARTVLPLVRHVASKDGGRAALSSPAPARRKSIRVPRQNLQEEAARRPPIDRSRRSAFRKLGKSSSSALVWARTFVRSGPAFPFL
jgi:hypothetical protein